MQRRDVETEDKGGGLWTKHSTRQASKHQHRACSLHTAVCRWSADCSRCGGSRIAASSFLPLPLVLLFFCCRPAHLAAWPPGRLGPRPSVTAHRVSTWAPNLATFVGLAIHAIPRTQ